MSGVKDFDAWRKQRNEVPIKFRLGGEEFAIPRRLGAVGLFDFSDKLRKIRERIAEAEETGIKPEEDLPSMEDNINWSLLRGMMPEIQFERFLEVCKREAIDSDTIAALCEFILEEGSGRPSEPSSDSQNSPSQNGVNSKDGSSSQTFPLKPSPQEKHLQSSTP